MVTISKFSDTFSLAGGLNLPKIIECIGSDGRHYKQLVKGIAPVQLFFAVCHLHCVTCCSFNSDD
jgi:hypothetical protein